MHMGLKMGLCESLSSRELEAHCQLYLTQLRGALATSCLFVFDCKAIVCSLCFNGGTSELLGLFQWRPEKF